MRQHLHRPLVPKCKWYGHGETKIKELIACTTECNRRCTYCDKGAPITTLLRNLHCRLLPAALLRVSRFFKKVPTSVRIGLLHAKFSLARPAINPSCCQVHTPLLYAIHFTPDCMGSAKCAVSSRPDTTHGIDIMHMFIYIYIYIKRERDPSYPCVLMRYSL